MRFSKICFTMDTPLHSREGGIRYVLHLGQGFAGERLFNIFRMVSR